MVKVQYTTVFPGYVRQLYDSKDLVKYDDKYVERYSQYGEYTMSCLRLDNILFHIILENNKQCNVLDVGYGSGSFLKTIQEALFDGPSLYGYDIVNTPVTGATIYETENEMFNQDYHLVTMFDSLEHVPCKDVRDYLVNFKTKYFVISVPWFRYFGGDKWFEGWKHRRPNEHIHHFDSFGLIKVLDDIGFKVVSINNCEDEIRKPQGNDNHPNILTVIAEKYK